MKHPEASVFLVFWPVNVFLLAMWQALLDLKMVVAALSSERPRIVVVVATRHTSRPPQQHTSFLFLLL